MMKTPNSFLLAALDTLFSFSLASLAAEERRIDVMPVSEQLYVLFGFGETAGNMAASIGNDGVLIVDDQSPNMAPLYKDSIHELGGNDIDFVINSHWHYDHADGNKALGPDGTWIVAQANSRRMLLQDNLVNLVFRESQQPD